MTKDEIRKRIKKLEGLIEEHEKNNRIAHWKPWPHQQQALDFLNAGKKVILIQGGNRIGKEQPVDAIVYTPSGPKTIGSLKIGDEVFSGFGGVAKVSGVYPQGIKPVYRVVFSDGASTECGLEHLWTILPPSRRFHKRTRQGNQSPGYRKWITVSLRTIMDRGWFGRPTRKAEIPMVGPVSFQGKDEFAVHPYVLGVLIGDGGLCHQVILTSADQEIIDTVRMLLPEGHGLERGGKYEYRIVGVSGGGKNGRTNIVLDEIRRLGLNVLSNEKFIPDEYKYSSYENRLALLRGLLDTDGSVYGANQVEFCSTSLRLAQDVQWLVRSLGGSAKIKPRSGSIRVFIKLDNANPFSLPRKAQRITPRHFTSNRLIESIEFIGNKECVCISVEPGNLYVTDDFIVTHNTVLGVNITGAACLGVQPWNLKPTIFGNQPVRVRIVCIDEETKIFTKSGWRGYNEVKVGDLILTVNPQTLRAEWQPIRRVIPLHRDRAIHLSNKTFDAVVTPEHRWLITDQYEKYYKFVETQNLKTSHKIPVTINYSNETDADLSNEMIRLLAWVFTEGTYDSCNKITIYQSQKHPDKCNDIEETGFITSKFLDSRGLWHFSLAGDIGQKIKSDFPDKVPTLDFILSLSSRQQKLFYETLILGDGTRNFRNKKDIFYNAKESFVDVVQVLAMLLGYRTYKYFDDRPGRKNWCLNINWGHTKFVSVNRLKFKDVGEKNVWCVEVENHTIVISRKNSMFAITSQCVDWEHHAKEVVVPVLKEWLPKGTYVTKKNNVGIEAYWEFPETGSTIEILTHSQETRIHEGWKGHLVWSDEPLPKDKYTANLRGLIDYSGVFIMTMTALYEPWILDEIVLSNDSKVGAITEIPMSANPMLKVADIENFARGLTQEERDVRVKGGWLQLTGRVLKEFKSDLHKVKDFKVPTDWPVIAVIDIHLNKPQAVGFYGWDKYDRIFVIDEIWENLTPEQVADEIVKRKFHYPRMKDAFIDPLSKGDNAYIKNRFNVEDTFTVIERKLMPHGIRLYPASKDKSSGIRNLKARLEGPNGMPTLFFMEHCQRHLWEIQRWVYDKEGQPVKENDHFMENLYRATLSGVKYTAPGMFGKPLQYKHAGIV